MLDIRQGDILSADVEALVNSVNCVGVMGRGIALQFRQTYPENFKAYAAACKRGEVQPGRMFVFETGLLTNPRYIINFPTKRHWRGRSRIADIEAGLDALVEEVERRGIRSIALPPLGSGLGGLEWSDVRVRIEHALARIPEIRVIVFEPSDARDALRAATLSAPPRMTPGRAVLVGLLDRYLAGLLDPFVTLLETQKLMYFMQESGEHLRLQYVKAIYGPYAENLRHVLTAVEGHYISGYADGGDAPTKQIQLVPGAVDDTRTILATHLEVRNRFDKVVDLVQGFETPFGLELLASVHWVATREGARTSAESADLMYRWNQRKQRFTPDQISLAWGVLQEKGWLPYSTASADVH
jgi:O-acetyl-ADP-ribose deacetylase (regulator of RNase III)